MDKKECVKALLVLFPEKQALYIEHRNNFGELLLHVFSTDAIHEPLISLLQSNRDRCLIKKYCDFVESMWREGDDSVVNVVDVTILERISDDPIVWQRFGTYISEDFKKYINEDLLINNSMMWGVKELESF